MKLGSRPVLAATLVAFGPKHCSNIAFLDDFVHGDLGKASRHEQDVCAGLIYRRHTTHSASQAYSKETTHLHLLKRWALWAGENMVVFSSDGLIRAK